MKNITLEDLLQKHFGLKGDIDTLDGFVEAYGKMVDFLYDLGGHVKLHINKRLGDEIIKLVDTFDEYEHDEY